LQIAADFADEKIIYLGMSRHCTPCVAGFVAPPGVIAAFANEMAFVFIEVLEELASLHSDVPAVISSP
jgi:hypothetical protein